MKSFEKVIYFHREKEENWEIERLAKEKGFKDREGILYLGYEIDMNVEIREDLKHKVLSIQGIDVSDKDIFI